jgi:hypothetical protein
MMAVSMSSRSQPVFTPRGIGGGGALFFPTINPSDPNDFYVSCDMSELFHSSDQGLSYSVMPFTELSVSNISTYEFTSNPLIAYCSYNDGNNTFPVKTNDGGSTWTTINAYDLGNYGSVYGMKANPARSDQFIVGAYGDILISNDGGTSFSLVKHASNMGAGIILGGVVWDGNSIYIGTNEGILYSSNGGTTFSTMTTSGIPAGEVIWSFTGGKTTSSLRFCCITASSSGTYNGIMPWDYYGLAQGVYTMDNANGTWTSRSAGINFSSDYVMYASMSASDNNTIYLGGNDNALGAPLVFRSTNGGTSWSKVFNTTGNANISTAWEGSGGDKGWGWSETCFGITAAPGTSSTVMFSTYSNVQISNDGGNTWHQAYVNQADEHPAGASTPKNMAYHSIGLENTTCWQVNWIDANTMMASFSDIGGIKSNDGGNSWGFQYTGFSVNSLYRTTIDNSGTIYGACSNIHDMYQSTRLTDAILDQNDANGKIVFSTDNGATWQNMHLFNHPVFWLAIDPNNQSRMYASVIHSGGGAGAQLGGIYKTDDLQNHAAATWTKLSNPPRTEGHPACIVVLNDGKMVCTFSGRRNSGGAFTASSGVFIFDPVLNSWTDVSDAGMHYWTKDLIIDPTDATQNTWYVCVFSGWGGPPNGLGGLYKTTNRGTSWTKLTNQFNTVTSITFNPMNPNQAFLTTETQGLWMSSDMNTTTPAWTLISSYPFRQPERVFFNPYNPDEMWVTSFGNGMKTASTSVVTGIKQAALTQATLTLFPNPVSNTCTLNFTSNYSAAGIVEIYNSTGALIAIRNISIYQEKNQVEINTEKLRSGIYMIRISSDHETFQTRMVKE